MNIEQKRPRQAKSRTTKEASRAERDEAAEAARVAVAEEAAERAEAARKATELAAASEIAALRAAAEEADVIHAELSAELAAAKFTAEVNGNLVATQAAQLAMMRGELASAWKALFGRKSSESLVSRFYLFHTVQIHFQEINPLDQFELFLLMASYSHLQDKGVQTDLTETAVQQAESSKSSFQCPENVRQPAIHLNFQ